MDFHERMRRDELYPQWLEETADVTDEQKRRIHRDSKLDTLFGKADDLQIWQDADNNLWLGWQHRRADKRVIYARLYWDKQLLVFCVPRIESTNTPWKSSCVWKEISDFRMLVPTET